MKCLTPAHSISVALNNPYPGGGGGTAAGGGAPEFIHSFKAGRCEYDPDTQTVTPVKTKGLLFIQNAYVTLLSLSILLSVVFACNLCTSPSPTTCFCVAYLLDAFFRGIAL